jgi:transposase, IS30 family
MNGHKDLSLGERFELKILLDKGYSRRAIARVMDRGKSTIAEEINHNNTNGVYDPKKAHAKARVRKQNRRLEFCKIERFPDLKRFIVKHLKLKWNPDEIAGYLKLHRKEYSWYVSKTAIYTWLRTSRGERYCQFLYSKRKRIKKRRKKTKRVMIQNRVSIHKRGRGADNRTRYGHWEADTVVSKKGVKGGLKTAIERKSRLLIAQKVENMSSEHHADTLKTALEPYVVKSMTYDNGIENREYQKLGVPSFFADPYRSSQRGSNEQANKMLRWPFPKKTDFSLVSQQEIDREVLLINKKPRKILGYRSALEVAEKSGMMKNINSGGVRILG